MALPSDIDRDCRVQNPPLQPLFLLSHAPPTKPVAAWRNSWIISQANLWTDCSQPTSLSLVNLRANFLGRSRKRTFIDWRFSVREATSTTLQSLRGRRWGVLLPITGSSWLRYTRLPAAI